MKEINVTGQKRTDLGKKASKTLRKEGLIPCNLYGEKKGENGAPAALSFAKREWCLVTSMVRPRRTVSPWHCLSHRP